MKNSIIKSGGVWLVLVVLTVFGVYNAAVSARGAAYLVLGIGFVKFSLIFFDFMEMKHAHRVWKALMALYVLILVGALAYSL